MTPEQEAAALELYKQLPPDVRRAIVEIIDVAAEIFVERVKEVK